MVLVSVIIPTRNRFKSLKNCILSLLNQDFKDYEIIVVDDGSSRKIYEKIKELYPKSVLHLHQENKGPAAARNLGVRNAKGKVIAFCDDDCVVPSNWIRNIVESYNHTNYSIIGGQTLTKQGNMFARTMQYSQDFWLSTIHTKKDVNFFSFLKLAFKPYKKSKPREVNFLPSNNFSFRKGLSFFDESFSDAAGEDIDFTWSMHSKGYKIFYNPNIISYHYPKVSFSSFVKRYYKYGKNFAKFKDKHPDYSFNSPNSFFGLIKFFLEPFFIPFLVSMNVNSFKDKFLLFPLFGLQEFVFRFGFLKK